MLDNTTKRKIDSARQILVGKVPDPKAQVEQITTALVYKFMDDMDKESIELGGEARFFANGFSQYAWSKLMDNRLSGQERLELYVEAIANMSKNPHIPQLFRDIFKGAFLPFRDPRTLSLFLKEINEFNYDHSENLGNAFEYLLSILGSQGDAGQFRTPRHIIDFIVEVVNPQKNETILDPACGTAGFLISAYKHIMKNNSSNFKPEEEKAEDKIVQGETATETVIQEKKTYKGDLLSPDDRIKLTQNIAGYDISPDMVKLALVNLYLHGFSDPKIFEYDTLSSDKRWDETFDVILANPPFMTPKGGIQPHKKFSIQANRAEVLFVDYIAEHLSIKGRAGIIVPEGIIFQSANAYKNLRKNLIDNWGLYAVVSLPSGVFQPYSGVKTSILLMDREFAKRSKEILFVHVKNTGISLGATNTPIKENDLPQAHTDILNFQSFREVESPISFTIDKKAILNNGSDLSASKYKPVNNQDSEIQIVKLKDIAQLTKGKSSSTKTPEGEYPLFLTAEDQKTSDHFDFEGNGVAVPLISALGHGKADIKRIHKVSGKFALANLLVFIESNKEICSSDYLYHCLNHRKKEMAGLMSGAANVSMKVTDIENFQIPLPPLEVQEKIVAEIERYQKVIDGARQVVENWKPDINFELKILNYKLKDLPMAELGEVFQIESGGTPSSKNPEYWDGDIKWATLVDIPENISIISETKRTITEEGLKKSSAKLLPKGTILVSSRATIGRIAVIDCEMATNQGFKNILVDDKNNSLFVAYMLSQQVEKMNLLASGGTFKEISKSAISTIKIPLPPLEVQEHIVAEIEAEQRVVDANKELIGKMEKKIEVKIGEVWGEEIRNYEF